MNGRAEKNAFVESVTLTLALRCCLMACVACPCPVDSVTMEEQERERRRLVVERFQTAPFEEIAAHCGARVSTYAYCRPSGFLQKAQFKQPVVDQGPYTK